MSGMIVVLNSKIVRWGRSCTAEPTILPKLLPAYFPCPANDNKGTLRILKLKPVVFTQIQHNTQQSTRQGKSMTCGFFVAALERSCGSGSESFRCFDKLST